MRKSFTFDGKRYWVVRKNPDDIPMAIAEKKAELMHRDFIATTVTVSDYADKWMKTFKEPYVSKSSISMYRNAIRIIKEYVGFRKMCDVVSSDIQYVITEEYNNGKGKSSIDKIVLTLRQIFKQAEADGIIKTNPTKNIRRPQFEKQPERALTDEEYNNILEVCKTSKYGNWILFMLLMGLRPGETARLKKEHFNPSNETMYIDGTKTEKAKRIIPLCDPLLSFVKNFDGDYLFTTSGGKKLTEQQIQRWWKYFKRELDLHLGAKTYRNKIIESKISPDVHLYTLRHTFATRMAAKVPINILAEIMGHSSVNVTYKYYIHYNEENMRTVRDAMKKM